MEEVVVDQLSRVGGLASLIYDLERNELEYGGFKFPIRCIYGRYSVVTNRYTIFQSFPVLSFLQPKTRHTCSLSNFDLIFVHAHDPGNGA